MSAASPLCILHPPHKLDQSQTYNMTPPHLHISRRPRCLYPVARSSIAGKDLLKCFLLRNNQQLSAGFTARGGEQRAVNEQFKVGAGYVGYNTLSMEIVRSDPLFSLWISAQHGGCQSSPSLPLAAAGCSVSLLFPWSSNATGADRGSQWSARGNLHL